MGREFCHQEWGKLKVVMLKGEKKCIGTSFPPEKHSLSSAGAFPHPSAVQPFEGAAVPWSQPWLGTVVGHMYHSPCIAF